MNENILICWIVTQYEDGCLLLSTHCPDDGGNKYLWNYGKLLPDYMVLQPRRQPSSYSPPWESQILHNTIYCLHFLMYCSIVVCVFPCVEGGNPADMATLDGPDISSLSDNIDSTDDLVPSLQVSRVTYVLTDTLHSICGKRDLCVLIFQWMMYVHIRPTLSILQFSEDNHEALHS
jgi:hypothetical protein